MTHPHVTILLAAAGFLIVATAGVRAAESDSNVRPTQVPAAAGPTALELSDQGLALYRDGDYSAAVERFKASYALSHRPLLLYDIGQSYRRMNDCAQAASAYRQFIKEAPDSPVATRVNAILSDMAPCPADRDTSKAAEAGTRRAPTNAESELPATPPSRALETSTPRLAPAPTIAVAQATSDPTAPGSDAAERPLHRRWWFWTAVTGALAIAVVLSATTVLPRYEDAPCIGERTCK